MASQSPSPRLSQARRRRRAFPALALLLIGPGIFLVPLRLARPAAAEGSASQPGELFSAGAGARALGMGGAFTAVSHDVASMYYNPAGLGLLPGRQVAAMYAKLFEGASYNYLAYAQNSKKRPGAWGIELLRLSTGGGEGRDALNRPSGGFDYSETGIGFGAGMRGLMFPLMSVGARFTLLNRGLANSQDRLMGLDVGVQYGPIVKERLTLGVVLQNAINQAQGDTQDRLTPHGRVGASYRLAGPLLVAADVSNAKELRFGTEYSFNIMSLRAGFEPAGFSFGTGFLYKQAYSLDLALVNHPTLGMSQRLSVGYRFAPTKTKKDNMAAFAQEYLSNALLELEKRNYMRASQDLSAALGINARLGDAGWATKARRLKELVTTLQLEQRTDMQEVYKQQTQAALLSHQAVTSYLDRDDGRAILFAHAAHGQDTRTAAYHEMLLALAKLTRREVRREDILPVESLISRRLQIAVNAVLSRKFGEAVIACQEALLLDPNSAVAWTRLGSAHFAAGDRGEAREAWMNALRLNPGDEKLRKFMEAQNLNP